MKLTGPTARRCGGWPTSLRGWMACAQLSSWRYGRVSGQGPLLAIRAAAPAVRPALLMAGAVAEIVRAAIGEQTPDARCDEVWVASGGNPFYLGELLRAKVGRAGRWAGHG